MTMNKEVKEFALRFNQVLDKQGFPPKWQGRHNAVGAMFNVNSNSARKWIEGMGLPRSSKIIEISKTLGVNFNWLMTGEGEMEIKTKSSTDGTHIQNAEDRNILNSHVRHSLMVNEQSRFEILEYNVAALLKRVGQLELEVYRLKSE